MKFSSSNAPGVVKMITPWVGNDENVINLTTFPFKSSKYAITCRNWAGIDSGAVLTCCGMFTGIRHNACYADVTYWLAIHVT